jgi:CheY-like chemotaxis protein
MELPFICEPTIPHKKLAGAEPPRTIVERLALLVEDEWLVRLDLTDALESAGWTITETNSGEDALALLRQGERFDVVITDIRLHGAMTGWDVADVFRASNPDIGIIYASGNPALAGREVTGSIFLAKPVRIDQLVAACERIWQAKENDPSQ